MAGALSMAAGEYVSVSSQVDPEGELRELAGMYQAQGLRPDTALEVARQLTAHDALAAHARVELGINDIMQARPLQAAFASGAAFVGGAFMPVLAAYLLPLRHMVWVQYGLSLLFLAGLGAVAARAVGASVARITFWGTVAMGVTAAVGW